MNRRISVLGLFGAISTGLLGQPARAEMRRVAVLAPSTKSREEVTLNPFFEEMRRLGWVEGQNVHYDRAYGDDLSTSLPFLASELVARNPDLIFAPPSPAAVAAKRTTRTIPIVFATGTDPVGTGLVASLAKPGGNVTGVLSVAESLAPKLIQMLREVLPGAKRLGVLNEPTDPRARIDIAAMATPARVFGFTLVLADVANPATLNTALSRLVEQRVDAIVTSTSLIFNLRVPLLEFANAHRVPVAGHRSELAEAGAIFTYGSNLNEQLRRAAQLVDKVLNGTAPSEIPVEQPTKFELVVNLKASSLLGVKIPQGIMLRADRVIE